MVWSSAFRLRGTSRIPLAQRKLKLDASDAGFNYIGQSVFQSMLGGKEVVCILERDREAPPQRTYNYKLLATKKTSTMQKELTEIGEQGYELVGMTVGETLMGGSELVTITRKPLK